MRTCGRFSESFFPSLWLVAHLLAVLLTSMTAGYAGPASGEQVLDYLPADSLAFVLVREPSTTDEKIMEVIHHFDRSFPRPLEFARLAIGLDEGLDMEGDLLLAFLPPPPDSELPTPMVLLPVTEYESFARSVNADEAGEVCRTTIAGEELLVARLGNHALLMNPEHRQRMEAHLGQVASEAATVFPLESWLAGNDATLAVMPKGIEFLAELGASPAGFYGAGSRLQEEPLLQQLVELARTFPSWDVTERMVSIAAVGLAIDDHGNCRIRGTLKPSRAWQVEADDSSATGPFQRLPERPFVFAGGGNVPPGHDEHVAKALVGLAKQNAELEGFENFTDQDWREAQESYRLLLEGVEGLAFLVEPAREDEPLFSTLLVELTVDDSSRYLEGLDRSITLANTLTAESTSDVKLIYETSSIQLDEVEALEVRTDVRKATGDENNPVWQSMLEGLLGADGVLTMYFCAPEKSRIVLGIELQEKVVKFMEDGAAAQALLANEPLVQETVTLLDPGAAWKVVFNPRTYFTLVSRAMEAVFQFQGNAELPAYPAAPPIGFSLQWDESQWSVECVLPAKTLDGMADFYREYQGSRGR